MGFVTDALFGESGQKPKPFRGYGWQEQGKTLNDLFLQQAKATQGNEAPLSLNLQSQYNPYQFTNTFNATKAVQDAFTPQANQLRLLAQQQEAESMPAIQADLARRGLQRAGTAPWAINQNRQNIQSNLSGQLAQLSGQQAGMNLQAQQFGAQLEQQRQLQQAAEYYRNRGASDQQALMMAQYAMARQQQPYQNLMQLYGASTGGTPGYEGSGGLLGSVGGALATGAGYALGGPIGGAITNGYFGKQKGIG